MSSKKKATIHGQSATFHLTAYGDTLAYLSVVLDAHADPQKAASEAYEKVAELLADRQMDVLHERIFGSLASHDAVQAGRREALGDHPAATGPVTYLQGPPLWGEGLAGINLMAVRSQTPGGLRTIADEAGVPAGRAWEHVGTTFLFLQSMHGRVADNGVDNSREAQADRMFLQADALLRSQQTDYRSVARTWIYLSKILDWYGEFNGVRSHRYGQFGLMPDPAKTGGNHLLLPASTGIEADGSHGAEATMDVLAAVVGDGSPVEIHQMTNARQKDAFQYGSAFSRGAAIRMPGATVISISGTAAIDEAGVSLFPGDFHAQMHRTLDTIEALIAQEGAALSDLCDMSLFVKNARDAETFGKVLAERGLEDIPGVPVVADVCRDDLLFEADGTALVVPS